MKEVMIKDSPDAVGRLFAALPVWPCVAHSGPGPNLDLSVQSALILANTEIPIFLSRCFRRSLGAVRNHVRWLHLSEANCLAQVLCVLQICIPSMTLQTQMSGTKSEHRMY